MTERVPPLEERAYCVKALKEKQGEDGSWNVGPYQTGLYNGLELADAILDDRDPEFKELEKED
ncbi:MAG: hypothetical protein FWD27_00610 [Coriobacteriia bacterium]|nr:hypothetical protein [Coriobacteriia bacterium]